MPRTPAPTVDDLYHLYTLLFVVYVMALSSLAWVAGAATSLVAHQRMPQTPVRLCAALAVKLMMGDGDPSTGWYAADREGLTPHWLFWLFLGLLATALTATAWAALIAVSRWFGTARVRGRRAERDQSPVWAGRQDVLPLLLRSGDSLRGRILLGRLDGSAGPAIATPKYTSLAVIAPTGSSKTVKFVVPTVLRWQDAVFVTSTKSDVIDLTIGHRAGRLRRPVYIFDPSHSCPPEYRRFASAWSPLMEIETYADADKAASWLSEAASIADNAEGSGKFWEALAQIALAPMLYLARMRNLSMEDVANWISFRDYDAVEAVFAELETESGTGPRRGDLVRARRAWTSTMHRGKMRDQVLTMIDTVLKAFTSPSMMEIADIRFDADGRPYSPFGMPVVNMRDVLEHGGTLYVVGDEEEQQLLRPAYEALAAAFLRSARRLQRERGGTPLANPPLMLLEEAANVAPLQNLDKMAATYRGFGIVLMSVWQDEAQVSTMYGTRAATVLGNHTSRVYLPGSSDVTTLERLSQLIGDQPIASYASASNTAGRARKEATADMRLAPVDYLRTFAADTGICLSGRLPPIRFRAAPWYQDPRMRALVGEQTARRYDHAFGDAR